MRPNEKWNPYVGFGIVGRYFNNYKLEHYFIDNNTGYEYEVKGLGKVGTFDMNIWQSHLGMDYRITNKLLLKYGIELFKNHSESKHLGKRIFSNMALV